MSTAIEEQAQAQGISVSQTAALLIEEALSARTMGRMRLEERLAQKAERALAQAAGRLADLSAVAALEATHARLLLALVSEKVHPQIDIKTLNEQARQSAAKRVKIGPPTPTPEEEK